VRRGATKINHPPLQGDQANGAPILHPDTDATIGRKSRVTATAVLNRFDKNGLCFDRQRRVSYNLSIHSKS